MGHSSSKMENEEKEEGRNRRNKEKKILILDYDNHYVKHGVV